MDDPKSPSGSVRRHGRNTSHPIIRRSTKGPLDADFDPLAEPIQSSPITSSSSVASPTHSAETRPFSVSEPPLAPRPKPNVDLRFLQDPNIYHQLSVEDVPAAFLESPHQPAQDSPLPDLVRHGHFRRAATASLVDLMNCASNDVEHIFQLLYTRLACLTLISRPDLAAQEAIPLTELLARNPVPAKDLIALIPWELRLLLVRLQSVAAEDGGRRGVMALYALAGEVRTNLLLAKTNEGQKDVQVWSSRLRDLGLRVSDALVEMGELETAIRHLDTLVDADPEEVAYRKALLRLRIGDVSGAEQCIPDLYDTNRAAILQALLRFADGDSSASAESWRALAEQQAQNALFPNNLAVSMLYSGHILQAADVLSSSLQQLPASAGLLFNLASIYELCTERATSRKEELTRTIATKQPQPASGGWERMGFEFKL